MIEAYPVPGGPGRAEIEVRRSRFLARVEPATSPEQARAVVADARESEPQARHHCHAWVLGPDGVLVHAQDDGEPAGTAGAPILDALHGSGLRDVVAVVTRWFGGTLLGTGGLVRAYGDATRAALAAVPTATRRRVRRVRLDVAPAEAGRVEHEVRAHGFAGVDTDSGSVTTLTLDLTSSQLEPAAALVARLTSGRGRLRPAGEGWVVTGAADETR